MRFYKADSILIIITIIWAGTFSIVKDALTEISPYYFITFRFGFAALLFLIIFNNKIKIFKNKTLIHGLILGLFFAVGFCLQTVGLQYTTASKSAFITGMLVIFAPIFQMLLEKRWINLWQIIGVIFSSIGLYVLSSPAGGSVNIGDIMTLFAAMLFGLYVVFVGVFSKVSDVNGLVFIQFIVTIVIAIPLALIYENLNLNISSNTIYTLIYTSVLATVLTTYLQTRFQKETTATRAAIIYTFEPVFAALISFSFFNEIIGSNVFVGGALIIIGLLCAEFSEFINKFIRINVGTK